MKMQLRGVRLGFHDLWKPKSVSGGAEKYSATLIATPDSILRIKDSEGENKDFPLLQLDEEPKARIINRLIGKVIAEKWPGMKPKAKAKIKVWCWNKADGSTQREEYTNDEGEFYNGFDAETKYVTCRVYACPSPRD